MKTKETLFIENKNNNNLKKLNIMTKQNFKFTAYDSKGNEIKLKCADVVYGVTREEASLIGMGIACGLMQKYKDPQVYCNQI